MFSFAVRPTPENEAVPTFILATRTEGDVVRMLLWGCRRWNRCRRWCSATAPNEQLCHRLPVGSELPRTQNGLRSALAGLLGLHRFGWCHGHGDARVADVTVLFRVKLVTVGTAGRGSGWKRGCLELEKQCGSTTGLSFNLARSKTSGMTSANLQPRSTRPRAGSRSRPRPYPPQAAREWRHRLRESARSTVRSSLEKHRALP
eukprot:3657345-Rhodomonas_salina.2